MKYPKDASEDICLLSLVEEDDFSFYLYQHEIFSLDAKEVKKDSFKDIPNFLPPSTIELKPLPSYLKYVFLVPNETLPAIISSPFSFEQEHILFDVLSSHKSDILGILMMLKGLALKLMGIGFF